MFGVLYLVVDVLNDEVKKLCISLEICVIVFGGESNE